LSIFSLPWLTFTFCIIAPFFFIVDRMGWHGYRLYGIRTGCTCG
jgi:hypothetical protein